MLSFDTLEREDIIEVGVINWPDTLLIDSWSLTGENTWLPRLLSCSRGAWFSFKHMSFKRFRLDTFADKVVVADDSDPVEDSRDRLFVKDDKAEDKLALSVPGWKRTEVTALL